ncbi:cation-transporting atpase 4 protein [Stemphylium lycopersici]|uniref:Cation-transporting atpase 4 protein n=1 Tax=Stemphylium lycopersici TaxID=183478 RepID=A0A364MWE6_STELY|nr:cation-transporting atpase 4 protein [Stemphylium lycopersici]RAR05872.1 cation-transporting atpase 4 protein [Stemphylium lycopersici]
MALDMIPATTVVTVTSVMLALSWATVILRIWVRKSIRSLGADDFLMVVGLILFSLSVASSIVSISYGIGRPDKKLGYDSLIVGAKWYWLTGLIYAPAGLAIKCSICTGLLRFTTNRVYKAILHTVITLSIAATFTTTVALLSRCTTVAANWDLTAGTCSSPNVLRAITYFYSAASIVSDLACAILPIFVLWNVQLQIMSKIGILALFALGFLASAATIIRLVYFVSNTSIMDYLTNAATLGMWTFVELGIGIVGGSVATLKPLFRKSLFSSRLSRTGRPSDIGGSAQSYRLDDFTHSYKSARVSTLKQEAEYPRGRSDAESQIHMLEETIEIQR